MRDPPGPLKEDEQGHGPAFAIGLAVALSLLDVVRRSARPHDAVLGWVPRLDRYADVSLHPSAQTIPGIVVYRVDARLDGLIPASRRHPTVRASIAATAGPPPTPP